MKKLPFLRSAFAVLCCALMLVSCNFTLGDEDTVDSFNFIDPQPALYDVGIATSSPDVTSDPVEFRGAIVRNNDAMEVAYGFVWYDPNDPVSASNPTRIDVGVTSGTLAFTAEAIGLPTERQLIVCAFVDNPTGNNPEMVIGDEVPFTAPDPEK